MNYLLKQLNDKKVFIKLLLLEMIIKLLLLRLQVCIYELFKVTTYDAVVTLHTVLISSRLIEIYFE